MSEKEGSYDYLWEQVKFEREAVAWFKREFPAIIEYLLYIIKKEGFTEEFEKFREMFK